MRRLIFITRHYPPSPNINGESICDAVEYFTSRGLPCDIITMDRDFAGGGGRRKPEGNVHKLRPWFPMTNPFFRFLNLISENIRLVRKALSIDDSMVVISSSPPLLPMFWNVFAPRSRPFIFWAFDLFPEGFAATGRISKQNFIYRLLVWLTYLRAPNHLIALGPGQHAYLERRYRCSIPATILPCGVFAFKPEDQGTPEWYRADRIMMGYCGNVGDPHDPDFIRSVIDAMDADRQVLMLALYGKYAEELKSYARSKAGVKIVDHVPRAQLRFIDLHLVSLRPSWTHIAVPSKAVSAIMMGRAILFCGDQDSDNWRLLAKAAFYVSPQNLADDVRSCLSQLHSEDLRSKHQAAERIAEEWIQKVPQAYEEILNRI